MLRKATQTIDFLFPLFLSLFYGEGEKLFLDFPSNRQILIELGINHDGKKMKLTHKILNFSLFLGQFRLFRKIFVVADRF